MKKRFVSAAMLALLAGAMISLNSCSKKDSDVTEAVPENEPMTTVKLTATNEADNSDVRTATWTLDPDAEAPDTSNYTLS